MKTYANIEEFYAENNDRRTSGEADYGVWWTENGKAWPKWRVSYIHKTGEVYAVQLVGGSTDGIVKLLGVVPPDDDKIYYKTLDLILDGWAEEIHNPSSLVWVERKLG